MFHLRNHPFAPPALVLFISALVVLVALLQSGGDPLSLARLGTRFSSGDPQGTSGYDGQFVYYIAADPVPARVRDHLDTPAYRYQRILSPLLARGLAMGYLPAIPWMILLLGLAGQGLGTWAVSELLVGWGVSRWYALVYGLWAGFLLALVVDLPEPMAFGLVASGLLASRQERRLLSWVLFGLALFAKEVTVLFVAGVLLAALLRGRWRDTLCLGLVSILPYALFQVWLFVTFGQFGIASGGEMATPFEWIPFMGMWRIGLYSLPYLGAMLFVFGPAVLWPTVWGIWVSAKSILSGLADDLSFALLLNGLAIVFLPFSTFRETGGLLRFACGLVLAVLLFAGKRQDRRVLNILILWGVLNVFLLKS
jgi:hypothetical protein